MFPFDLFKRDLNYRIKGSRCYLQPLRKSDIPQIKLWFKNKELVSHAFGVMAEDYILERLADKYINNIYASSDEVLGVWLYPGIFVGFFNYIMNQDKCKSATIGIIIGTENNRSKGIGTDAVNLALYYLFYCKGLSRVDLDTACFNVRAQKCFYRCGFKKKREITEVNFLGGELIHKVEMSLERERFYENLDKTFPSLPIIEGNPLRTG